MTTVIGVLLIIMAVFLVISVLMQSSKDHRHGGTVSGAAETFFGKNKGKSLDALFNKLTTVVAIIFVLLVIALYVMQDENALRAEMYGEQVETEQTAEEPGLDHNHTGETETEDIGEQEIIVDDGTVDTSDETVVADDGAVAEGNDGADVQDNASVAEGNEADVQDNGGITE